MFVRVVRALGGAAAWRRWVYLLLGAGLLSPFALLVALVYAGAHGPGTFSAGVPVTALGVVLAGCVPLVVLAGLLPVLRSVEVVAVHQLLAGDSPDARARLGPGQPAQVAAGLEAGPAASLFAVHALVGGVVSALVLGGLPAAVVLVLAPLLPRSVLVSYAIPRLAPAASVAVAVLIVLGLLVLGAGAAAGLRLLAGVLLRPDARQRVGELERHNAVLTEREHLARELHDSVGHALSIVAIQAAAADRVLSRGGDRAFVAGALQAVADSARTAQADLDHALGVLRDGPTATAPAPTLSDADALVSRVAAAGVLVHARFDGAGPTAVPTTVSREAYRILQEGLTNAVRHAPGSPVEVGTLVRDGTLDLSVANRLTEPGAHRSGLRRGGSGLSGIRDRVAVLGGTVIAGPDATGGWALLVRLPLEARR